MAKNAYPRFQATRTYTHKVLGRVKVFDFTNRNEPEASGAGAQTDFFRNNAEINNPKQFGIKLFSTSIEAFAAYQRQRLAAREDCAPPVGCMVQWKRGRWSRWGYETCIADTGGNASTIALILGNPLARKKYNAWAKWAGVSHAAAKMAENIDAFERDSNCWLVFKRDANGKYIDNGIDWERRPAAELALDERLYQTVSGRYEVKWDISCYSLDTLNSKLRNRLTEISLTGTQYDSLWELHDDGAQSFERDPRLTLGSKFRKSDAATMGGDLHSGNVGLWRNKPVSIDFGFHCVISARTEEYFE